MLRWVSRREREVANPEAWLLQAAKWACASLTTRRLQSLGRWGCVGSVERMT